MTTMGSGDPVELLPINSVRAGDVLLCYGAAKLNPISKAIRRATSSEYTHAAICVDALTVAESVPSGGVTRTSVVDLAAKYDHLAVFRQPDAWRSKARIKSLNDFVDRVIETGAKYNYRDLLTYRKEKETHEATTTDQLHAYFSGNATSTPVERNRYFCSELVVHCFIAVGFIDPSAAVVYKPNLTPPGALGRDAIFGTFCGYISSVPNYVVPRTDEFYVESTFAEIFGAKKDS